MSDYFKAVVKGQLAGVVQFRNIYYASIGLGLGDTAESLWSVYLSGIYTPLLGFLSGSFTITDYDIYEWGGTDWIFGQNAILSLTGGSGDPALPNYIAGVLIGKVLNYRGFGRKFIPGIAKTNYSGNALAAGALAAFVTAAAAYVTPWTTVGLSTFEPGLWLKDNTFKPFVSGLVASLLGSMRRRKPGLGI